MRESKQTDLADGLVTVWDRQVTVTLNKLPSVLFMCPLLWNCGGFCYESLNICTLLLFLNLKQNHIERDSRRRERESQMRSDSEARKSTKIHTYSVNIFSIVSLYISSPISLHMNRRGCVPKGRNPIFFIESSCLPWKASFMTDFACWAYFRLFCC